MDRVAWASACVGRTGPYADTSAEVQQQRAQALTFRETSGSARVDRASLQTLWHSTPCTSDRNGRQSVAEVGLQELNLLPKPLHTMQDWVFEFVAACAVSEPIVTTFPWWLMQDMLSCRALRSRPEEQSNRELSHLKEHTHACTHEPATVQQHATVHHSHRDLMDCGFDVAAGHRSDEGAHPARRVVTHAYLIVYHGSDHAAVNHGGTS